MPERRFKKLLDSTSGALTVALLGAIKHTDRKRMANFAGALLRKAGPLFKEHRLGRAQLRAAFPEKSDAEIEKILGGVWNNLGRIAIEFAHLDEFCVEGFGAPTPDVITYPPESKERYDGIVRSGKASIGFAAHLANWELPGIGAKLIGVKSAVLYRRPNIDAIDDVIQGRFHGGIRALGLADHGVDWVHEGDHAHDLPPVVVTAVEALRDRVARGEIHVPTDLAH